MFARTLWAGAAAVVLSTLPTAVAGQQSGTSASLSVTASVSKNCTISTTPVNFGAYDPVVANASSPQDSTGTVTVAYTKGANARVGLDDESNNQGATRRMQQSSTAHLNYEIYKDAAGPAAGAIRWTKAWTWAPRPIAIREPTPHTGASQRPRTPLSAATPTPLSPP